MEYCFDQFLLQTSVRNVSYMYTQNNHNHKMTATGKRLTVSIVLVLLMSFFSHHIHCISDMLWSDYWIEKTKLEKKKHVSKYILVLLFLKALSYIAGSSNPGGHSIFFWWVCAAWVFKCSVYSSDFFLKN